MKRAAVAVSVSLSMAPSAAFAVDWSITTTQTETVELNSNPFLSTPPAGTIGSYTTLKADAEARTADSKFNFDADGSYRKYWGPGTADISDSESTNWGFRAHYELDGQNNFDKEFVETSWRQQSTALAILNDLGVSTNVNGAMDRLTATGGIDRSLSALDSVSFLATTTRTSFEPSSGGIPFTDTLGRGTWSHNLSSATALTASSEGELLNFDNAFGSDVAILRNQIGVNATLSPLLSFRGEAGAAYLITKNGVGTGPTGLPIAVSSTDIDWIGDAVLTYKMFKDTTLTLNASQSIGPSIVGSIFKRDTVSLGLAYTINNHSTLSFSASGNQQTATGTSTDYVSASVTYGYNFTRDWTTQLTYRYLHRFASTGGTSTIDPITDTPTVSGLGPTDSHSLMLVVSHSYNMLPRGN